MPLFKPYSLGTMKLPNRVVMSAMTRSRSGPAGVPTELTARYFAQRATAGLIVTGSIAVSPQGRGYLDTEGLYTAEQVEGWRSVTAAVHDHGGRIAAQLIHCGRVSHASLQPAGNQPPGVSDLAAHAEVFAVTDDGTPGMVACAAPRPMSTAEVEAAVGDFATAAANARRAGFDAVEVQGGNGFLVEQFLHPGINTRTDHYGDREQGRAAFLYEVVAAIADAAPGLPVGVKLTPGGVINDIPATADWNERYLRILAGLDERDVAYVTLADQSAVGAAGGFDHEFAQQVRRAFSHTLILGGGYAGQTAGAAIGEDHADLIAFGRPYLANPDLVGRLANGHPLANADVAKLYGGGAEGYVDYPTFTPRQRDRTGNLER